MSRDSMDNMVREQSLEDIERLHVAREEAQNSFWDCVRPDESPAGDRTKAAGILVRRGSSSGSMR